MQAFSARAKPAQYKRITARRAGILGTCKVPYVEREKGNNGRPIKSRVLETESGTAETKFKPNGTGSHTTFV